MPFGYRRFFRTAVICIACGVPIFAADFSSNEVRTLLVRPGLIQEMDWQPIPSAQIPSAQVEAINVPKRWFFKGCNCQ
jgi:hypothetical protein